MPATVEEARTRGNDAHVITRIRPKLNGAEGVIADAGQPRSGQFGSDRVADSVRFETVVIERRVLIRDCLVRCLKDSMRNDVIGSFSTVEEWLKERSLTPASPVIVLCSAERTEAEVDSDVALLSQADAGISIVILSDREDAGSVLNALDKGARGYITTSMAFDVAVHAIRLVRAGGTFVPARTLITSRVSIEKLPSESEKVRDSLFTARQAMVVESLRQGKANKIIAYERNMCESTVKVHVRNIMKKLGARNRTEVAFMMNGMEGKTQQAEFSKSRIACCNQLSAALPASRRLGPQPTLDHHRP